MINLHSVLKSRDVILPTKVHMFNSFSRSHIWMSELDSKESWAPKSWCFWTVVLLKERGHLTGPETGFLSNTRKWIARGDTCADKARDFIGNGHLGGEQEGKGTQENCSVTWLAVSGFMVMGLVSRLSLANHSDSESFLVVPCSAKMDAREKDSGRWSDRWCLLLTFPKLFWLVEAY